MSCCVYVLVCFTFFLLTGLIILKDWNIKSEFPNQEVIIATFSHSFLKEELRKAIGIVWLMDIPKDPQGKVIYFTFNKYFLRG